ncbi:hypothetical protein [Planctellipticum variicoloris]|uniref:hypothetical protein n=1 Tax=Planctellipticum variicoloris TaxID=3064265 RepID=UPI0030139603|nr:hypothetical protein SH412_002971 [Planctomycetaceae bacterium SH412]
MEEKVEAILTIGSQQHKALLHLFTVDQDDMRFRFGRASVSGVSTAGQLVHPQRPTVFMMTVTGSGGPWRVIFFSGVTEWGTDDSVPITHADFYVLGCPEMTQP